MNRDDLEITLKGLIAEWENEVVEFKNVGHSYSTSDIGKYFSALANEANLRDLEKSWLVFGVDNKSRTVVGSDYRSEKERLHSLKHQIAQAAEPSITFRNIHELDVDSRRVVMFEIPAAPKGIPIAWKGHYYARAGESLTNLGLDKQDEIRGQGGALDWSAQVVEGANLTHLDDVALQ
jgi:ATP-dependent DNA helicase RecG